MPSLAEDLQNVCAYIPRITSNVSGEAVVYLARADNVTGIALNVAGGAEVH